MQELALHASVDSPSRTVSELRWMPEWIKKRAHIEAWLADYSQRCLPPLYASVDIRHSAHKVAVIDTNLFSAGFNNLDDQGQSRTIAALKRAWNRRALSPQRIIVVPERHTRNPFYIESLMVLTRCIEASGAEVRIGFWDDPNDVERSKLLLEFGWSPILLQGQKLCLEGWVPDLVVLNNDLSLGVPAILRDTTTPIIPSVELGWHKRLKSSHFSFYKQVVEEFASAIGIDAWPLHALFSVQGELSFSEGTGIEALQENAAELLETLNKNYKRRGIVESPYLVIKADAGTYGMGIMVIHDAAELDQLNRKQRNKMGVVKDGLVVDQVILQEGISSLEQWEGNAAESVLYMVDNEVVGRFYRVHPERDAQGVLNAPGMLCKPVQLQEERDEVYLHTVVGRLALMAAAREQEAVSFISF